MGKTILFFIALLLVKSSICLMNISGIIYDCDNLFKPHYKISYNDTLTIANLTESNSGYEFQINLKAGEELAKLEITCFNCYSLSIENIPNQQTIALDTIYMLSYSHLDDGGYVHAKLLGIRLWKKWKYTGDVPNKLIRNNRVEFLIDGNRVIYKEIEPYKLIVDYNDLKNDSP